MRDIVNSLALSSKVVSTDGSVNMLPGYRPLHPDSIATKNYVVDNFVSPPNIVNNLNSNDATEVLSANMGRVLDSRNVPLGGRKGDVLIKNSAMDNDVIWSSVLDAGKY